MGDCCRKVGGEERENVRAKHSRTKKAATCTRSCLVGRGKVRGITPKKVWVGVSSSMGDGKKEEKWT